MSKVRGYENFHILLWLLKDSFWLMEWKLAGISAIVPVMLLAFRIAWLDRKDTANLLHNIAIICWLCGDSIWMIGDFFFNSRLKQLPATFFGIGILVLAIYYLVVLPREKIQHTKNYSGRRK